MLQADAWKSDLLITRSLCSYEDVLMYQNNTTKEQCVFVKILPTDRTPKAPVMDKSRRESTPHLFEPFLHVIRYCILMSHRVACRIELCAAEPGHVTRLSQFSSGARDKTMLSLSSSLILEA
jgi:hypothetical protein